MTTETINITFTCKRCGGAVLTVDDDATDASIVSCKGCGTKFCTYGELKAASLKEAKTAVNDMIRKTFAGRKGWKVS